MKSADTILRRNALFGDCHEESWEGDILAECRYKSGEDMCEGDCHKEIGRDGYGEHGKRDRNNMGVRWSREYWFRIWHLRHQGLDSTAFWQER